jgi:signal transduction histidine kinase/ligand-binding sensor domain-containing protein
MQSVRIRAAVSLSILLWCHSRAFALNPALDITQYAHTAWTSREGFFGGALRTIAQTADGYLWLGTESGLMRFDGVRTVRWQPRGDERLPSTSITELLVTRDGRLWIGTFAGLASWKDGGLIMYPELAGLMIGSLVEDSNGTVWVGTLTVPNALLCAIGSAVQCVGQDGRFGSGVFSLLEDGGTLWVGAASGLWRWTADAPKRYPMPTPNLLDLIRGSDGTLLIAMQGGIRQVVGQQAVAYATPGADRPFDARRLLLDRNGALWVGTPRGLVHMHQGRTDLFTRSDGLSSDLVNALYEDREGNVWVATDEGLDRFRDLAVTTLAARQGLATDAAFSVLSARDGSMWAGTGDGVTRWKGGRTTIYRKREGLPDDHIGTIFEDSAGRILVSTLRGVATFDGGKFVPLRGVSTRVVYGIVEERPGELWIADQEQGLLHVVGEEVVKRVTWSELGHDDHATALVIDPTRAGLWLGFYNGGVVFVKEGTIRASYGPADGLGAGRVSALQLEADGALWAATASGLSRINDKRIATLTMGNGLPCDTVHWTIADVDRSLWLSMPCGLARISSAEVAAWIADPRRSVTSTVFDRSDGVWNSFAPAGLTPPAARLPDGRLWFAAPNGIGVIDPRQLPFNTHPPAVHVEQIVADRKAYATATNENGTVRLPPRVRDLQFDYTALSFVAPEKVRFRYKLEGHDGDWQDVGTRRQAFYNDLRPGTYRFRVTATNNSGVWNEAGAFLDFSVAAAYYQTTWFLAVSITAFAALVWGGHRVRLSIVEQHKNEIRALNERLMKAQEQERIRIAGELHDGVMQEMLAVAMMLGTAKRRIPANSDAQPTIEKAQQKLIQAGSDIRQLSHELHPPLLQEAGLPRAVQGYCEQFSDGCSIPVVCEADERVGDLSRGAALALFRIVQEALGNAAKHGAAKLITVRLTRSEGVVSLTVADDGVGFDRSGLGSAAGLGLITMRERAAQLNGTFELESTPGRGTTISVEIPFR